MGKKKGHTGLRLAAAGLLLAAGFVIFSFVSQLIWAHRYLGWKPEEPRQDLSELLVQPKLSREDYDLLFTQTGLSQAAVDDLRSYGGLGVRKILEIQEEFYAPRHSACVTLIGGRFTCEDLLRDREGRPAHSVSLAPFRAGDILVTLSTHTLGWRHGHAGLVTDPIHGRVLEAAQMGVDSHELSSEHWKNYSTLLVLRVKDAVRGAGEQVAAFAREWLDGVPYSLLAGLLGPKLEAVEEGETRVQCAYLPWRAWASAGEDLDGDGGKVVTVRDLAESDRLEVVQVYGVNPELVQDRQCRR